MRLNAAHQAIVPGVLDGNALGQHHLDMGIVKMHGRKAHASANHIDNLFQVFPRRLVMHARGKGGLVNFHMAHSIHQQVGQFVGGVIALAGQAAHAHIDKGLVAGKKFGAALGGDPHHFAHLDEHAAGQVESLVWSQASRFKIGLVEWIHVLINSSYGHAGLVFLHHQERFHCPDSLNGFLEGLRRMRRHPGVDLRNILKFSAAPRVGLLRGQAGRVFGHAARVNHYAFRCLDHGFVKVNLVQIVGIGVIQHFQMLFGLVQDSKHALFHKDYVITGVGIAAAIEGMIGAVGNKGFAGKLPQAGFPVLGLAVFVHRLALPVGENFLAQNLFVFLAHIERILRPFADCIQFIPEPAPGNIGRKRARARGAVGRANNQLIVLDYQRSGFTTAPEGPGPQKNTRQPRVFPVDLRNYPGPVDCYRRLLQKIIHLQELVAPRWAVGHIIRLVIYTGFINYLGHFSFS